MSSPGIQESQLGQEPATQSEESHRFTIKEPHPIVSRALARTQNRPKGSGVSSAPSMRSDVSRDIPPDLAEERNDGQPTGSVVSSAPSMRSDVSRDIPPDLAEERNDGRPKGSGVSSAPSMRSDVSRDIPPDLAEEREQEIRCEQDTSGQDKQEDRHRIFEVLEKKIVSFVKKELQRFKHSICPDYQGDFEKISEDESDAREGALKMAVHFLSKMGHCDLAEELSENKLNLGCQRRLKRNLKNKYQNVLEGIAKQGSSVLLEKIYTDLYIIEGGSGKVNEEHEVRQIESKSKSVAGQHKPIKCADIFKTSPDQHKPNQRILTKGVAGIGKTISVHKYILDWAKGTNNQEINFIFPLCFRELNLMRHKKFSLMDLLYCFFPELKQLTVDIQNEYKVLFVFDGLDECRLHLNFQTNERLSDVKVVKSLDVVLTNLILGNLFPSALIWITSRPAAACKIPPQCVDMITEVQGFNDSQKEEYFRKRINNESLASEIISHIKSSRILYIMCHMPVFCWIAATVLEIIISSGHPKIPKTLTEMYTYFLIFQTRQSNIKFDNVHDLEPEWNLKLILNLGKLAYTQLEKGNLIFYNEDLKECGIDVKEASVYSGVCTQIFREESGICLGTVFSFVHLSIQEYLAALYAFLMMAFDGKDIISKFTRKADSMIILHKIAVNKALAYEDGRFDLFLRFLLGLSQVSNQSLLHGLISRGQMGIKRKIWTALGLASHQFQLERWQGNDKIIHYIKESIKEVSSSERMINLFHCLNELNDHSLVEDIQRFMNAGNLSEAQFSPGQWSALVFVLLTSDQSLDVFDLKKYIRSDEALLRLKPVVEESHTIVVDRCGLTEESCVTIACILCKTSSKLRSLELSCNPIGDAGVTKLCSGLKNPNCSLETLRLSDCGVTGEGYASLAAALKSNPSHLEELDLRGNDPGDSGVKLLTLALTNQKCKLRLLSVEAERACEYLTSVVGGNPLLLTGLDLSKKIPGDSGVKQSCALLEDSHCRLRKLKLKSCGITDEGCAALASMLTSNPSHLTGLSLRNNEIGDSGVEQISTVLRNSDCKIQQLGLGQCSITDDGCAALVSALTSNPSHLISLYVTENKLGDSGVRQISTLLRNPDCKLQRLGLGSCSITEKGCAVLASALTSNPLHLIELYLDNNVLGDSGVRQISALLRNPDCKLQILGLESCSITEEGCAALASALTSNPSSHLRRLYLGGNKMGDSGVKQISALLRNPGCKVNIKY